MKHIVPGDGYDTVNGDIANNKALVASKESVFNEEKFRSKTQLVENTEKLHKELSVLLGLSGNINNIAPGMEASFSKDLKINQFHAYFVIVLDVEKSTKELNLDDLKLNEAAHKLAVEDIKEFRNKHGNRFVNSVTYGKKFVAVVQIKDMEKALELKRKFDGKIESQYAKAHLQIEHAIQAIRDLSSANVFIYSAGSDTDAQDPQVKLNAEVSELYKLLNQFNKNKPTDNNDSTKNGGQDNNKTADKGEQNAKNDNAASALKSAISNVVDKIKADPAKAEGDKKQPQADNKPADDAKKPAVKADATTADNVKLTLNLAVGGKEESPAPADNKDNNAKKGNDAAEKYVPLRYSTKNYSVIDKLANLKKMDIAAANADNLLAYVASGYHRISAYLNSVNYAFDNAQFLPFTLAETKDLTEQKKKLKSLKLKLREISTLITDDIYSVDEELFNDCARAIAKIYEEINAMNSHLINFDESAFLLSSVRSKEDHLNWELFKLHFHRTSHHTMPIKPPAGTKQLMFVARDSEGNILPDNMRYDIRKDKYGVFSTVVYKKLKNVSYADLPGQDMKSFENDLKAVYVADPHHAGRPFNVDVYAKVGPRYDPLTVESDLKYISAPAQLDDAINEDKIKEQNKGDNNTWYTDSEISTLVDLRVNKLLGGYVKGNNYLIAGNADGKVVDEDNNEYFVLVTSAIDTQQKALPLCSFLDKSKLNPPDANKPDTRRDIFDEIGDKLKAKDEQYFKILFPYNITNVHWLTGEIKMHKNTSNYIIDIYAHDPFGKGKMQASNFELMRDTLIKKIKEFDKDAKITVNNNESPYAARQADGDGNSCGVITVMDMIKRASGKSLSQANPYPEGVRELRLEDIKLIKELPEKSATRKNFLKRYDFVPQVSASNNVVSAAGTTATTANLIPNSIFVNPKQVAVSQALQAQQKGQIKQLASEIAGIKLKKSI